MPYVTVYRVETPKGDGPHVARLVPDSVERHRPMPSWSLHAFARGCPCPLPYSLERADGTRERQYGVWEHAIFGFPNMGALFAWFDATDREALRPKVNLAVFDVPRDAMICDQYQVCFYKCRATLVRREALP